MEHGSDSKQYFDKKNPPKDHRVVKRVVFVFIGFVLVLVTVNVVLFAAGFRAGFFHRWAGDQYFGRIAEVNDSGLVIVDENGRDKSVLFMSETQVRKGRQFVTKEMLVVGSYVIVVGSPNNTKQIEARIIRIFADGK